MGEGAEFIFGSRHCVLKFGACPKVDKDLSNMSFYWRHCWSRPTNGTHYLTNHGRLSMAQISLSCRAFPMQGSHPATPSGIKWAPNRLPEKKGHQSSARGHCTNSGLTFRPSSISPSLPLPVSSAGKSQSLRRCEAHTDTHVTTFSWPQASKSSLFFKIPKDSKGFHAKTLRDLTSTSHHID